MNKTLLSLFLVLPLAACSGAESYQKVPMPPQDVELSSPAVCRIYVLRMPQVAGRVRGVRVRENEREIGRIGRESYLCWERPPGRTVGTLDYDGPKIERASQGVIDLNCEAGQVYYFGIQIETEWNTPVVQPLTRDEALAILREQSPAPVD